MNTFGNLGHPHQQLNRDVEDLRNATLSGYVLAVAGPKYLNPETGKPAVDIVYRYGNIAPNTFAHMAGELMKFAIANGYVPPKEAKARKGKTKKVSTSAFKKTTRKAAKRPAK